MTDTDLYPELRPLLFSIAYRMIGSVSEAEDIVQEAFLRYHRAQPVVSLVMIIPMQQIADFFDPKIRLLEGRFENLWLM